MILNSRVIYSLTWLNHPWYDAHPRLKVMTLVILFPVEESVNLFLASFFGVYFVFLRSTSKSPLNCRRKSLEHFALVTDNTMSTRKWNLLVFHFSFLSDLPLNFGEIPVDLFVCCTHFIGVVPFIGDNECTNTYPFQHFVVVVSS